MTKLLKTYEQYQREWGSTTDGSELSSYIYKDLTGFIREIEADVKKLKTLYEKSAEMRRAQRNYFAARSGTREKQEYLKESKQLEAEVDSIIQSMKLQQKNLF